MRPSYLQKIREKIPFPGCYFLLSSLSPELLLVQVAIDVLPSATLDFVWVGAGGPELGSFPNPQIHHILPGLRLMATLLLCLWDTTLMADSFKLPVVYLLGPMDTQVQWSQ